MGGLLQVKSAPMLEKEQAAQKLVADARLAEAHQPKIIDNLAAHVHKCWEIAKSHRARKGDRLANCLRRRKGEYSSEKLKSIRAQGGAETYMNIIGSKCNAAKSWLSDLYSNSGDKPFQIDPTPIPELDPQIQHEMISTALEAIMQTGVPPEIAEQLLEKHEDRIKSEIMTESETRMEKMSEYIEDILTEGDFRREFEEFIDDLCTYPVAIFKGPIYRKERSIKWVEDEQGNFAPQMTDRISRKFRRVSPFNFYESPSMTTMDDGWCIELLNYTAQDLERMRHSKGYNKDSIGLVLNDHREGGLREWTNNTGERDFLEGKQGNSFGSYDLIDGLEFTGHVQGKQLIEYGIEQRVDDPYREYPVSIIVVGNHTIKAMINPDPAGKPGYYKANFRTVPNSFYGEALPEILEDIQDVCNATIRALVNNMAIGAQPQVAIDISMLPPGSVVSGVAPGKTWQYSSKNGQTKAGVSFFSPEIKSQELLGVYERFERYADERSGIPAYAQGSDNARGAGQTASGLSMLLNAASKTIKAIVRDIDIGVIEPLISNLYQSAMLDPEVPSDAKGDAKVKARGSDALMHKEATAMRQLEFMNMTNNPIDMQIVGVEGRREMLEIASKNSEFPTGRVVPTQTEFEQRQQQQMMQQNAQPDPNQTNA